MSLMWKLLATTLLLSSIANASATGDKIENYLDDEFSKNSRISKIDVKVVDEKPLKMLKGWKSYIVDVQAVLKSQPKKTIKQKMIWFSNGEVITKELADMKTGEDFIDMVKPDFKDAYYKKENLIYGNANAKHRIAIFSDPLCPFCKDFTPAALTYMKKYPKRFAVYYYHFPLVRIHPASAVITRAAIVAERKGIKDVNIKMYNIKVNPREKDVQKILTAFNKATGANVTPKEIVDTSVVKQIAADDEIARNVFVAGTPTIYVDDKIDKTRILYKSIK